MKTINISDKAYEEYMRVKELYSCGTELPDDSIWVYYLSHMLERSRTASNTIELYVLPSIKNRLEDITHRLDYSPVDLEEEFGTGKDT
jgi:hypothetical protein